MGTCEDVLGVDRVGLYFAAQAADVDPDKIGFVVVFLSPPAFQQDFVCQDHTSIPGQGADQLVFGAAELYRAILEEYQVLGIINREVTSGEDNLAGRLLARRGLAAQKSTDTCQQLF